MARTLSHTRSTAAYRVASASSTRTTPFRYVYTAQGGGRGGASHPRSATCTLPRWGRAACQPQSQQQQQRGAAGLLHTGVVGAAWRCQERGWVGDAHTPVTSTFCSFLPGVPVSPPRAEMVTVGAEGGRSKQAEGEACRKRGLYSSGCAELACPASALAAQSLPEGKCSRARLCCGPPSPTHRPLP